MEDSAEKIVEESGLSSARISRNMAALRISTSFKRKMNTKLSNSRSRHSKSREKYLEKVLELHNLRSEDSRDNDSFLVEASNYEMLQQKFFMSNKNKEYVFSVKIYRTEDGTYCYSLFIKKGRNSIPIWQYHKFSDDFVSRIEPSEDQAQQYVNGFMYIAKQTADYVFVQSEEFK